MKSLYKDKVRNFLQILFLVQMVHINEFVDHMLNDWLTLERYDACITVCYIYGEYTTPQKAASL